MFNTYVAIIILLIIPLITSQEITIQANGSTTTINTTIINQTSNTSSTSMISGNLITINNPSTNKSNPFLNANIAQIDSTSPIPSNINRNMNVVALNLIPIRPIIIPTTVVTEIIYTLTDPNNELINGVYYSVIPVFSEDIYHRIQAWNNSWDITSGGVCFNWAFGVFSYDGRMTEGLVFGTTTADYAPGTTGPCWDQWVYNSDLSEPFVYHSPFITSFIMAGAVVNCTYPNRMGPIRVTSSGQLGIVNLKTYNIDSLMPYCTYYVDSNILDSLGTGCWIKPRYCLTNYYTPTVITKYYGTVVQTVIQGPTINSVILDSIQNSGSTPINFSKNILVSTSVNSIATSSSSYSTTSRIENDVSNDLEVSASGGIPFAFSASVSDSFIVNTTTINTIATAVDTANSYSYSNTTTINNMYSTVIPGGSSFTLSKVTGSSFIVTKLKDSSIIFESCFVFEGFCLNVTLESELTVNTAVQTDQLIFSST
jgi:hypothetical protein